MRNNKNPNSGGSRIFNLMEYEKATHGTYSGEKLLLSNKPFGNTLLKGLQRKGMVYLENHLGEFEKRFVKLDDTNKARNISFEPYHDYEFSSITEDITSCLINNTANDNYFHCVSYRFEIVSENGRDISGSSSDNYIYPQYLEKVLTDNDDTPYNHYLLTYDEFTKKIATCSNNEQVLNNMIEFFARYGVERDRAKHFILQQAGFDLLTGNVDRNKNCTNFVFVAKDENIVLPINMDYGRCLQMLWTKRTEEAYRNKEGQIDFSEIEVDYVDSMLNTGGGILNNETDYKKNVKFLLDNGFEKLSIDLEKLEEELDSTCNRIQNLKPEIRFFARTKANVLLKLLKDERTSALWEVK